MIRVEFNDDAVSAAFRRAAEQTDDMSNLMNQIGAFLVRSNKDRLIAGVTSEGVPFAPRSQATLDRYAREGISSIGTLRQSGVMASQINHDYGPKETNVGSNAVQAAMMHFGGTKAAYPHLWGNIPARPFIGVSDTDRTDILDIVDEWLSEILD